MTQLAAFDRPVMVARGSARPPVAPAIATALAKLLPRAETHVIPGAAHGMLDTHAETVATLIDRLIVATAMAPADQTRPTEWRIRR